MPFFPGLFYRILFYIMILSLNISICCPSVTWSTPITLPALTTSEAPATLDVLSGNDIYLLDNAAIPFVARVSNAIGQPIAGILVTFQVTAGPGMLSDLQIVTDAQGEATTHITTPTILAPTCVVTRVDTLLPVSARLTGVAEASLNLIEVSGNNQVAAPGEVLEEPLVVRVESTFDTPIGNPCEETAGPPTTPGPQPPVLLPQGLPQLPVRVPVTGVNLTAEIIQGEAAFLDIPGQFINTNIAEAMSNAQGEAAFRIQVGRQEENVITQVTALEPALEQRIDFFTSVGFSVPTRLVTDTDGTLLVVDSGLNAILRVDPERGSRTLVSGANFGSGTPLTTPFAIAVEPQGTIIVVDIGNGSTILPAVLKIDPESGERSLLFSGPPLLLFSDIAIDTDGTVLAVSFGGVDVGNARIPPSIWRIDPNNGAITIISGGRESVGSGPPLPNPFGIATEAEGSYVVVSNGERDAFNRSAIPPSVVRVDPDNWQSHGDLGGD